MPKNQRSAFLEFGFYLTLACLALIGVGQIASGALPATASYEITGELLYTNLSGGRPVRAAFNVMANTSNYCIITYDLPGTVAETNYHWTVFNVTSNLMVQSKYHPPIRREHAEIKPLVAPVKCPDQASHFLWLTLTPSIHADEQGQLELPPVYNPSADLGTNPDLRLKCLVEYLDGSRTFINRIRFLSDGTINQFADGTNFARRLSKPYHNGFTEAAFETLATTNWNGLTVPIKILGEIFRPGNGRSAEDLKVLERVEINVFTINALPAGTVLPPPIKYNTAIGDRRIFLKPNQPLTYTLNGGSWPDEETALRAAQDVMNGPRFTVQPVTSDASKSLASPRPGIPFDRIYTNVGTAPFQLDFKGLPNGAYYVLASTNLQRWRLLGTATNLTTDTFQFIDFDATNYPHRYYRIHER